MRGASTGRNFLQHARTYRLEHNAAVKALSWCPAQVGVSLIQLALKFAVPLWQWQGGVISCAVFYRAEEHPGLWWGFD